MKKYISFLLGLIIIIGMTGCRNKEKIEEATSNISSEKDISDAEKDAYFNTFYNFESTFTNVRVKDNNYIIKSSSSHAGEFYEIYDNNENLLDKGYHNNRGSFDVSKEKNIVTLEYGFGGSSVWPKYRLYDVEKGKVSRYFDGPIAVNGTLIVYCIADEEDGVLVVQDIFDVDKFYREFDGKFDMFIYMKIKEIAFSEDGTKVMLKHHENGNESNIIEEVFELNN